MFGKSLIAAGAVIGLLSSSVAFAEPAAKPLSMSKVAKIQDLNRARGQFNYKKKNGVVSGVAVVVGAVALTGVGFGIGRATQKNNNI